ncbi:MAG: iron-containing alcohol dehydrogenase [Chlorobiaceae bacterium]
MKFEFENPTHLVFGAGTLSQIGEVVRKYGKKALLVTGGGSVKRNGTYERAVSSLKAAGAVTECSCTLEMKKEGSFPDLNPEKFLL